ncbi:MAG: hypothetical protein FWF57_07135 [Defluviitaleaceae bacterium]|nr:hypothetical protein [Defluviitaleaceae bacterium]
MKKKNKRYKSKQKNSSENNLKETFFLQTTACGIIILGILVVTMVSPAYNVRSTIASIIQNDDFFYIEFLQNTFWEVENTYHEAEDFRIDEELLEEINWRNE